ncbi:MAG: MBG domain-containing protein, partial [Gallionellaceae bacterium]
MNHAYRLIWSDLTQAFVVAAETVKAKGKRTSCVLLSASGIALSGLALAAPPAPDQLPTGGQLLAGQATVTQAAARMDIRQTTPRAVVEWQTFNVGSQAQVNINQPSAQSVLLNRVLDTQASQIFGRITANGQVFLTNPNGVYFSPSASVDVGGLVATTHHISNADFMAGKNQFHRNGATGSIVNEGNLTAALGGYIALLAPEVRNQGVIIAQLGTVAMAAGDAYELQFDGNNTLANLRVTPATIKALVENKNAIHAPGGLIILSAQAANQLQGSVVNNSGMLEAGGIVQRGGRIFLDSGENGQTTVSGTVDTNSINNQGGSVAVSGKHVLVDDNAVFKASGATGGGTINIGGGWQGAPLPSPAAGESATQATAVYVAKTARLDASATDTGNGGEVVVWSDIHNTDSATRVYGTLLATGGMNGGNGGRIETSGHWLETTGAQGSAAAPQGKAGVWLFDPYNVTITSATANGSFSATSPDIWTPSATASTLLNTDIQTKLNAGTSVTVTTTGAGSESGDITVNAPLTWSAGKLTLTAHNNLNINASLNASSTGTLAFAYGQSSTAGTGSTYTVATGTTINIPLATAFTWQKGSTGTIKNLVLDNGLLRFGNGTQASVSAIGQLEQPSYFDNTSVVNGVTRNGWYKLTIGANPLDFEVGTGGVGTSNWNRNGTFLNTQTNLAAAASGSTLEISKYKEGTGSITASINLGFTTGEVIKVANTFTLSSGSSFLKTDTVLTNAGSVAANNVRLWVGTRDDWVGNADATIKAKGNITANGFEQILTQTTQAKALKITETTTGQGAAALFYSTSSGADTSVNSCCSFTNATGTDPRLSAIVTGSVATPAATDGSYALFMRLADLTVGQSGSMTWYYAAGAVSNINSVVTQVSNSAGVSAATPITVTINPLSIYYGDTPSYTYSLVSGTLTGTTLNSILSGTPTCSVCTTPGTYSVTAGSVASTSNSYALTWQNGSLTVNKAPLTVTADNTSRYYGAANPTLTSTLTGFKNNETASTAGITGAAILSTTATTTSGAGTVAITPSAGTLLANNYTFTNLVNGTLTINPAPLTITANNATKTYGQTVTFAGNEFASSGLKNSETIGSVNLTSSGAINTANASTTAYPVVASSASGGTFNTSNYSISYINGGLTVNKAPLTVMASAATKTYDGLAFSGGNGVTYSGLVNGEAATVLGGTLAYSGTAQNAINAGSYVITPGGLTSGNYTLSYSDGALTVNKAALTVAANAATKTYDGLAFSGGNGVSYSGLVNGETS